MEIIIMDTKEKIKEAALKLFLTKGYSVGVNEIIENAGTSKGAFYHHYKSKGALFIDIVDNYFLKDIGKNDFLNDPELSLREKIILLVKSTYAQIKSLTRVVPERKGLNYMRVMAEYPDYEELKEKNVNYFQSFVSSLENTINNAIDKGIIKKKINAQTLSFHIGMVVDGSLLNAVQLYKSVDKAETTCIMAVEQLLDLLE